MSVTLKQDIKQQLWRRSSEIIKIHSNSLIVHGFIEFTKHIEHPHCILLKKVDSICEEHEIKPHEI